MKKAVLWMWRRVDVVLTVVSEERIASIFRVEGKRRKSTSEETVRAGATRLMSEITKIWSWVLTGPETKSS
jgi:hypothetical protein